MRVITRSVFSTGETLLGLTETARNFYGLSSTLSLESAIALTVTMVSIGSPTGSLPTSNAGAWQRIIVGVDETIGHSEPS